MTPMDNRIAAIEAAAEVLTRQHWQHDRAVQLATQMLAAVGAVSVRPIGVRVEAAARALQRKWEEDGKRSEEYIESFDALAAEDREWWMEHARVALDAADAADSGVGEP